MFFSFIPISSCPPASSPLSKNNYQLERMKASKCFFQYSWSQPAVSLRILLFMPQGSIIHSWGSASALFQIPKLADTHYWLVLLRLRWEKEYFLLPRKSLPQIALPILFPWLLATDDCDVGNWNCNHLITGQKLFCCTTWQPWNIL